MGRQNYSDMKKRSSVSEIVEKISYYHTETKFNTKKAQIFGKERGFVRTYAIPLVCVGVYLSTANIFFTPQLRVLRPSLWKSSPA